MAIDRGYITLAEFRLYKKTSNTGMDDMLEDLVEASSRYIDNQCNRFFYTSTGQTIYYTPEMSDTLLIHDIYGITTLKTDEDGDGTYENTWSTSLSTGDFWLMPFNADKFGNSGSYCWNRLDINPEGAYTFPKAQHSVQLIADFGWSGVPADIKQACMEIVNAAYGRRTGQNMSAVAEVTAAGVVLTPADIPQSARAIIDAYRKLTP